LEIFLRDFTLVSMWVLVHLRGREGELDEPGPTLKGYHDNNPKLFFGVASKYCNYPVLRASPVSTLRWQEPLFIKVCSRIAQIVLISSIDGSFSQWSF